MSEQLHHQRVNLGWIEVICGSMFSGKSEELIRRLRRAQIARQRVQIFKPKMDNRFSEDHIVSHSEMKIKSQMVTHARDIIDQLDGRTQVVGIDEGQFFDMELVYVCNKLADIGIDTKRLDEVAAMSIKDPTAGGNPIQFSEKQYKALAKKCVIGDLQHSTSR